MTVVRKEFRDPLRAYIMWKRAYHHLMTLERASPGYYHSLTPEERQHLAEEMQQKVMQDRPRAGVVPLKRDLDE